MKTIPLGKDGKHVALVDDEDYERLAAFKWHVVNCTRRSGKPKLYACRRVNRTGKVYMHREIMNPPPHLVVEHIDGNGLQNTRDNLELIPHAENSRRAMAVARKRNPEAFL